MAVRGYPPGSETPDRCRRAGARLEAATGRAHGRTRRVITDALELHAPAVQGEWTVAEICAHVIEMEPLWAGKAVGPASEVARRRRRRRTAEIALLRAIASHGRAYSGRFLLRYLPSLHERIELGLDGLVAHVLFGLLHGVGDGVILQAEDLGYSAREGLGAVLAIVLRHDGTSCYRDRQSCHDHRNDYPSLPHLYLLSVRFYR